MMKELIITIGLAFFIAVLLQTFVVETRYVPTTSMLPTIQINQRILVNKLIYKFRKPQRGEIIVFKPPVESEGKDYIKRVIGIEKDKIEIKNGFVYVNDEKIKEDFTLNDPNYTYGPIYVPENSLFVLGDNRNESYDSHLWGKWLHLDNIKGKAFFTYWPIGQFGKMR